MPGLLAKVDFEPPDADFDRLLLRLFRTLQVLSSLLSSLDEEDDEDDEDGESLGLGLGDGVGDLFFLFFAVVRRFSSLVEPLLKVSSSFPSSSDGISLNFSLSSFPSSSSKVTVFLLSSIAF